MMSEFSSKPAIVRSDEAVVADVLRGDIEAFGLLVERYQRRVFSLAARMIGNRVDAEDVAQEVFCKLYRNLDRYDPAQPLQNWLMRIASNHTLNWLEKNRKPTESLDDAAADGKPRLLRLVAGGPPPDDRAAHREVGAHIVEALKKLPDTQRLVFILKFLDGYTAEEIADILGASRNTVKTWIFRAREALRAELSFLNPGRE